MNQSTTRSAATEIRAALAAKVASNFDYRNIKGLTENPTVTQNPTRKTGSPYIYMYNIGQIEKDSTKDDTPFEYHLSIEVAVRYNSYRGGQRQAEQITNEVMSYVRGKNSSEYPDLSSSGFNVYNTEIGEVFETTDRLRGANYYKIITDLFVTASWTGLVQQVQPIQSAIFTYSGFEYEPVNRDIERYDSGDIVPSQTYPSDNNGWNFTTVDYSLPAEAGGVYDGTNYEVGPTHDIVEMDSDINYELASDGSITTTLNETSSWPRIDSIRYGAIDAQAGLQPSFPDDTSPTYGLRLLSNWNVDFGVTDPQNVTISFTGNAGQYAYIIVDVNVTLAGIRDNLGTNNIANFDVVTDGSYKYYISKTAIVFDNSSFTYTLNE